MLTIIGNPVSPYVRKILVILKMKEIDFEIDPTVGFFGDDEFTKLSPLRRIPVLVDDGLVVNDSSVIAQYLEEKHPFPTIFPATAAARARARWFEEYADTRMGDVFIWKVFGRMVISPAFFGTERDLEANRKILDTEVVEVMDYLESQTPAEGFLCGAFSIADFSVAVMFRNMAYARWTPDGARWPKVVRWLARVDAHPAMSAPNAWADAIARTPRSEHREKLGAAGMRISPASYSRDEARKGPMTPIG
ncbi:MAG: glutathione S-transferase family protein [Parvularculaceae bacterium]|nr:glutathione S-transferase family protein [Parvularculaceae bacterium]